MQLPLVEQIREARRLAEEAAAAFKDFNMLGATLTTIEILELRLARFTSLKTDIPGTSLVAEVSARWDELGWMQGQIPSGDTPFEVALPRQRALVESARSHLKDLADTSEERTHHLAHLQEEQQALLAAPVYAQAVEDLRTIGAEREVAAHAIGPLRHRLSLVEPSRAVISHLRGKLDQELELLQRRPDDKGVHRARTVSMMHTILDSLGAMLKQQGLELALPAMPEVTVSTEVADILSAGAALNQELGELLADFNTLGERLGREEAEIARQLDRLTKQLVERLG
ncbi:MAG: hypothetical protein JXX28_04750 [Deltaproteobacteria bacterium]|nr:hypothetical protein [Deltaproteobacteria bacterium]